MDILIVLKWLRPWNERTNPTTDPPGIIAIMINMFLKQGMVEKDIEPLIFNSDIQRWVCIGLVLTAILCVPLML